jgi:hypothetical protein
MKGKILISVLIGLMLALAVVSCDNGTQTVSSTDQNSEVWYSPSEQIPTGLSTLGFGNGAGDITDNWYNFFKGAGVQKFKKNDAGKAVKDGNPIRGSDLKDLIHGIYLKNVVAPGSVSGMLTGIPITWSDYASGDASVLGASSDFDKFYLTTATSGD